MSAIDVSCKLAEPAVDFDRSAVLLGDHVVGDRQAEPGAFAGLDFDAAIASVGTQEPMVRRLFAGGNRIRTIGPASGKVVDAKFQRSDPGSVEHGL